MFDLTRYIGPDESIQLRFGIGLQFIVVRILIAALLLGGISFIFQQLGFTGFFVDIPLIILGFFTLYSVIQYLINIYFITEKKVYRRSGFGFVKVVSAKKDEVLDMEIVQGFTERFLFRTGTIKLNTAGSPGFEVVLPRTEDPYQKKKDIYDIWNNA